MTKTNMSFIVFKQYRITCYEQFFLPLILQIFAEFLYLLNNLGRTHTVPKV